MTSTTSSPAQRRTYGGWRRPSSPGLGSLSLLPTLLLFLGLILSVVMLLAGGIEAGAITAVLFTVAMTPAVIKVNERPLYRAWLMRLSWWRIRRTKGHLYRSGLAGVTPQAEYRLPGLLAQSRAWEAQDTQGRTFALIEHPYDGSWTVVLDTNPTSGTLISAEDRDVRVAHWDGWLANLGREPGVVQVAVVIDQVPDPGRALRAAVESSIHPGTPEFAVQVMREAAEVLPTGTPAVSTHVAITFSGRALGLIGRNRVEVAHEAAVEIGTRLPGLARSLAMTGSGEGRPATIGALAGRLRGWYDPAVQVELAEAAAQGEPVDVQWYEAGPVATQESWSTYRHDSGLSMTFEMVTAPRGTVHDSVLEPLLGSLSGIKRKRVALLYRPVDSADAPAMLDLQVKAALNRAGRRGAVVHAHDSAEVRSAVQAAAEEASGAGVTHLGILVSVTVDAPDQLRAAQDAVTRAGRQSQLRLRPVYGGQAAAFAAACGVGVVLPNHALVPDILRANL